MKTEIVSADEIENNDFIVIGSEVVGYVYMVNDNGDSITFDVVDDDAEHTDYTFGPFDDVEILVSLYDEEDVDLD